MIFDVHNLYLKDAIDEILYKLEECKESGDNILQIIHGYKHGNVIKDYLRSKGFISDIGKLGYKLIDKNFSKEGVSVFKIRPSLTYISSKSIPRKTPNLQEIKKSFINEICFKCNTEMEFLKDVNWYKCPKCGKLLKR